MIYPFITPPILDHVTSNFELSSFKKGTSGFGGITSSIYLNWNISVIYFQVEIKLVLVKAEWQWLLSLKKTFFYVTSSLADMVSFKFQLRISFLFYVGLRIFKTPTCEKSFSFKRPETCLVYTTWCILWFKLIKSIPPESIFEYWISKVGYLVIYRSRIYCFIKEVNSDTRCEKCLVKYKSTYLNKIFLTSGSCFMK